LMSLLILTLFAAHQGEEFVIILPAVMLIGAFFILRWANQNDKDKGEDDAAEEDVLPEERPVGLVLPKIKTDDEVETPQETSV
jgi:1,4-dihydroxy-2-naphthoate octaprenyltransferase